MFDVTVYRLAGTKEQLTHATDILNELYPQDEKAVLEDARCIGLARTNDKPVEIYEVIIIRQGI